MDRDEREIELEIVSNSWLSLTDAAGYDALIATWADKIDRDDGREAESGALVDRVVARQLDPILGFLDSEIDMRHLDPLEGEIAACTGPAMVLSPDGTVATTAGGAETAFGVQAGRLAGTDWIEETGLDDYAALRRSTRRHGNVAYAILRARGPDGPAGLVEAYSLTTEKYTGTFIVVRSLELQWGTQVGEKLAQAYALTDAEVEICRLLFTLRDLEAVSRERGVTIGTARVQLKSIFAKTGLHTKADLVRLLAMLCAQGASREDARNLEWSDPTGRQTFLTRPDGRQLAHTWVGAEDGRQVVFIHGEIPLFYLPPGTQDALARSGVKLVCVSMPGHGSSDPAPSGVRQSRDALAALEALMADLGGPMPVAASYSGMSSAMELGCATRPLASALLILGMPWNITAEAYRDLPLAQRTLSQLARRSPRLFEMVCRLGWRMMIREGPDFYLTRALDGSEHDERIVRDANMQPYLRAAVRHLVAQGHRAFMRETLKGAETTPVQLLGGLKVPLHWLVPADEPTCTPGALEAALAMNHRITVEVVEEAGELLPYQRPDVFVRAMADLAADDPSSRFAARQHLAV